MSSPLASSSRYNVQRNTHLTHHSAAQQQQSLRFLLGGNRSDLDDSDDDDGRFHDQNLALPFCMSEADEESDLDSDTELMQRAKRARIVSGTTSLRAELRSPSKTRKRGTVPLGANTYNATGGATPSTPTKSRKQPIIVKGNVTPSKAFSIFKRAKANRTASDAAKNGRGPAEGGLMTPPPSSPACPSQSSASSSSVLHTTPQRLSTRYGSSVGSTSNVGLDGFFSPGNDYLPPATFPATSPAPVPLAVRHLLSSSHAASCFSPTALSVQDAIWSLKTRRSVGCWGATSLTSLGHRPRLNANSFLSTFVSPPSHTFRLPLRPDGGYAHPLCSAYSYSSRSVNPSAQWLAVGDDQGRLSLLNTLPAQDAAAESYSGTPSWLAVDAEASESIFELSWRFDDRIILTGGSDYVIRSWDVEYQRQLDRYEAHWGSPRCIVWDPTTSGSACGSVFASAGRDGAVHIWDARVAARGGNAATATVGDASLRVDRMELDEEAHRAPLSSTGGTAGQGAKAPVLSIYSAHTTATATSQRRKPTGKRSRTSVQSGPTGYSTTPPASRGRRTLPPKGVTSLCYLPDGTGHRLVSAGCENGVLKCWDLRHCRPASQRGTGEYTSIDTAPLSSADADPTPVPREKGQGRSRSRSRAQKKDGTNLVPPPQATPDLTLESGSNRRAHGISHLVTTATDVYASATDGRIYALASACFVAPLSDGDGAFRRERRGASGGTLLGLVGTGTASSGGMTDPAQRQNTLYARMAVYDDRFLAVGCNTGEVCLWDLRNPFAPPRGGDGEVHESAEGVVQTARERGWGVAVRSGSSCGSSGREGGAGYEAVVLRGGHRANAEVNSLSWCNGPSGAGLATVGDDAVVRVWVPGREEAGWLREVAEEERRESERWDEAW